MITPPDPETYIPSSYWEPGMEIKGFILIDRLIDGAETDKHGTPIRNLRGNLWWAKKPGFKKKVMICVSDMLFSDL